MLFGVVRVLESYHRRIINAASVIDRESHTSRAIALTARMLAHDLRQPFSTLDGVLGFLESSKHEKQFYARDKISTRCPASHEEGQCANR
jgi:nitrogen-specific signal transduction histidine kinase